MRSFRKLSNRKIGQLKSLVSMTRKHTALKTFLGSLIRLIEGAETISTKNRSLRSNFRSKCSSKMKLLRWVWPTLTLSLFQSKTTMQRAKALSRQTWLASIETSSIIDLVSILTPLKKNKNPLSRKLRSMQMSNLNQNCRLAF